MGLDKDRIVAEAMALCDEVGLEGLTTRALALRLGVKQPALYWHFRDRRALLDAMNTAIMARFVPPPPGLSWQEQLFALGSGMRQALLSCRDGARIHAGTRADRGLLELHMTELVKAGLPIETAITLMVSIGRMVVGWVLEEQAEGGQPPDAPPGSQAEAAVNVMRKLGEDGAFAAGLRMLITGASSNYFTQP